MLIHKKKISNIFFFLLISLFLLFISLFFKTPGIKGDIEQSIKLRLNQAVLYRSIKTHENKFFDYFLKTSYAIQDYLFNSYQFEEIELSIPFEEIKKLKSDREKALKFKRLIKAKDVDITLLHNENKYKATARLKGDLSDHWGNMKQWSLRIKLKKNKTIFGLNVFSIMMHETREFPYNYVLEEILKRYGLLNTIYKPIKVRVNGDNWGIMLLEEQYSESFFARHKIKEAPIFRFKSETGEHLFVQNSQISNIQDIIRWQGMLDVKTGYNKIFEKTNIPDKRTNETLLSISKNIHHGIILNEKEYYDKIIKHFNIEKFAKAYAIVSAFNSRHSLSPNNIRYYLNPYNLKLEPILRDHGPNFSEKNNYLNIPNFLAILSRDENFIDFFNQTILDLYNDLDWIIQKNKDICQPFGRICNKQFNYKGLKENLLILKNNKLTTQSLKNAKIVEIRENFNTKNIQDINKKKLDIRIFTDGTFLISNLTSEKILIKDFFIDKNKLHLKKIDKIINPSTYNKISVLEGKFNFTGLKGGIIKVEYLDEQQKSKNQLIALEDYLLKPSNFFKKKNINKFIKTNENNFILKENNYILKKGEYFFDKPIIIPAGYNFIVTEGSTLNMSVNSYIKIENGSIKLNGTTEKPIVIKSNKKNNFWGGIYVNSDSLNENESIINNTEISDLNYYDDDFIQLTGAINFYNTKLKILNSKFSNAISEDLLNLINTDFSIKKIKIFNVKSDAIDFDFSEGSLVGGLINNVKGDALDFSGSKVELNNIKIENIGDKAVSVGENSIININDLTILKSKIGLASKDSSIIKGKNIAVKECEWYDFASYNKKSYFKGGYISLNNSYGCNKPLVQNNSYLKINDEIIRSKKVNINKLYEGIYQ